MLCTFLPFRQERLLGSDGLGEQRVSRRLGSEGVRAFQRSSATLGRTANSASPSPGPGIIIAPLSCS